MCVHCLIKALAKILGYCMLLLCMLCRIFAPSDISEGGGFSNGESASTSSEVDDDMEGRLESAVNLENSRQDSSDPIVSGGLTQCNGSSRYIECHLRDEYIDLHPEIPEEDISGMSGKIAGGFPIQCQEDILESAVNLENSRQDSSDPIVRGGLTQCNGSRHFIECHLRDEYIDLHPEIPIRSIQTDQDQQNGEAHQHADRPFQASLGRSLDGTRFGPQEDRHSSYTSYLGRFICGAAEQDSDLNPDNNNMERNPVQVTDDTSSSGSGVAEVTGLKVPGTESRQTPMHSHSSFDGGAEIAEPVQDDYQGATGGAPNNDDFPRSIRNETLCIVCKKHTVEVIFEICGHSVCCFKCATGMQQCNVCKTTILRMTSLD